MASYFSVKAKDMPTWTMALELQVLQRQEQWRVLGAPHSSENLSETASEQER